MQHVKEDIINDIRLVPFPFKSFLMFKIQGPNWIKLQNDACIMLDWVTCCNNRLHLSRIIKHWQLKDLIKTR